MHIGFSTGAVAKEDFQRGIRLQESIGADSVELSALREAELEPLVRALPGLDLARFSYVSFHAPSKRERMSEDSLVLALQMVARYVHAIVVHPDVIENPGSWVSLQEKLVLENMDQRKRIGRTYSEIATLFGALPRARLCFDIAHARQVDPTLGVAVELLLHFRNRLAHMHISEVDINGSHTRISSAACTAYRQIASLWPASLPVIVESIVSEEEIAGELLVAKSCLCDGLLVTPKVS